jgi:branched-chain amino acid transport system ATP-binding protein
VHVTGAKPDELTRAGLCLVPEGRGIFPNLSVEENLWLSSYSG